jgi:hypothetical protein
LDFSKYSSESDGESNSFLHEFPLSGANEMAASRHPFLRPEQSEDLDHPKLLSTLPSFYHIGTTMPKGKNVKTQIVDKTAPKLNAMNIFAFRVSSLRI